MMLLGKDNLTCAKNEKESFNVSSVLNSLKDFFLVISVNEKLQTIVWQSSQLLWHIIENMIVFLKS